MVYNKYKKVTGIVTVKVKGEKDLTIHTEILNNILKFEKGKTNEYERISSEEYIEFELGTWKAATGKEISITADSGSNLSWDARNELGKEKPVRNNLNIHFKNEQDGTGDTSESRGSKEKSVKKSLKYSNDSAVIDIEETR